MNNLNSSIYCVIIYKMTEKQINEEDIKIMLQILETDLSEEQKNYITQVYEESWKNIIAKQARQGKILYSLPFMQVSKDTYKKKAMEIYNNIWSRTSLGGGAKKSKKRRQTRRRRQKKSRRNRKQ